MLSCARHDAKSQEVATLFDGRRVDVGGLSDGSEPGASDIATPSSGVLPGTHSISERLMLQTRRSMPLLDCLRLRVFTWAVAHDAPVPAALRIAAFHSTGTIGKSAAHHVVALAAACGAGGLEHARRMLGLIIRFGQRLVAPYVPIILRALLPRCLGK